MHFRFAENYITQLTHDIGNVQVCMTALLMGISITPISVYRLCVIGTRGFQLHKAKHNKSIVIQCSAQRYFQA